VVNAHALGRFVTRESPYALLDLADGTLEPIEVLEPDVEDFASPRLVAFSPDGTKLLYTAGQSVEDSSLLLRDIGGAEEHVLLEATGATALTLSSGLSWLPDGAVFFPTSPETGVLLTVEPPLERPLVEGANTAAATPAIEPTETPTGGPVDPALVEAGTPMVVNDAVAAVRSAPSLDAPVVAELAQGAEVVALGPAEEGDGFVWIPVRDPATGTIGYVRAELLSAV
jgi:hypothetical protein